MSYQQDVLVAKDGSNIVLTFYAHASVGICWKGLQLYVDPVGESQGIDFSKEPKADLILVTHHHSDHLDLEAIELLRGSNCVVCGSKQCLLDHVAFPGDNLTMRGIDVNVVPAYNVTPEHLQFHPRSRLDCGFILNLGGTRVYVAGDTEDNEDILSLNGIDIAFLPVNQPYTMTPRQFLRVVDSVKPRIVYPYHTASSMGKTDLSILTREQLGGTAIRIRYDS